MKYLKFPNCILIQSISLLYFASNLETFKSSSKNWENTYSIHMFKQLPTVNDLKFRLNFQVGRFSPHSEAPKTR